MKNRMIEEGTNVYVNHCVYRNSMGGRSVDDSISFKQGFLLLQTSSNEYILLQIAGTFFKNTSLERFIFC